MCNRYRRPSIVASFQVSVHFAKQFERRRFYKIGQSETRFSEQSTNICGITTCNERCINRVHLTFSLYTNCQNVRRERNSILQPLFICLSVMLMQTLYCKERLNCYFREHLIFLMLFVALTSRLVLNTLHSL
jgi:hypothetical protein